MTIKVEENVVMVTAKDWAHYGEQTDRKGDYKPIQGIVVGFLIEIKEGSHVTVSHTLFPDEDQIRGTTAIPWAMVEAISYLVSEQPEEGDSVVLEQETHGQAETNVANRLAREAGHYTNAGGAIDAQHEANRALRAAQMLTNQIHGHQDFCR